MRKIIILSLIILLIGASAIEVNAAQARGNDNDPLMVKFLRVGLKKASGKTLRLTINGEFKLKDRIISDKSEMVISIQKDKLYYDRQIFDVIELKPQDSNSNIIINYGKVSHSFTGSFEIRPSKGKVLPINIVPIEEYVEGVLPYEMASSYPLEALKAQAVTARNYAISSITKHRNEKFDVCDTIHCQVYKGKIKHSDKIENAVKQTRGEILTYNNQIVKAFFYSSNGGYIESSKNIWNSNHTYLRARKDEFDTFEWEKSKKLRPNEIESILKKKGYITKNDNFEKIGKISTNDSGRNSEIEVLCRDYKGKEKVVTLDGEEPRIAFSLKSSMYSIEYNQNENVYVFDGRGYGHGVGMSQLGAKKRAEEGHSYKDILGFYYPDTKLCKGN
ncbi:MAG: SpoIID/LytB domain-containing protein [Clostridium sp.]